MEVALAGANVQDYMRRNLGRWDSMSAEGTMRHYVLLTPTMPVNQLVVKGVTEVALADLPPGNIYRVTIEVIEPVSTGDVERRPDVGREKA